MTNYITEKTTVREKYVRITVHEEESRLGGLNNNIVRKRDIVPYPAREYSFKTGTDDGGTEEEFEQAIKAHMTCGASVSRIVTPGYLEKVRINYYLKDRNGIFNGSYTFNGAKLRKVPETFEEYAQMNGLRDCKETRQAFEDAKKNAEEL